MSNHRELVANLRAYLTLTVTRESCGSSYFWNHEPLAHRAADAIEQLERELAALQEALANLRKEYENSIAAWTGINEEKERAEALAESYRKDAERYRWLRDCSLGVDILSDPDNGVIVWYGTDPARKKIAQTLDAAIDAAMKESKT